MPVERPLVDRPDLLARRARVGEPAEAGRYGSGFAFLRSAVRTHCRRLPAAACDLQVGGLGGAAAYLVVAF